VKRLLIAMFLVALALPAQAGAARPKAQAKTGAGTRPRTRKTPESKA